MSIIDAYRLPIPIVMYPILIKKTPNTVILIISRIVCANRVSTLPYLLADILIDDQREPVLFTEI